MKRTEELEEAKKRLAEKLQDAETDTEQATAKFMQAEKQKEWSNITIVIDVID